MTDEACSTGASPAGWRIWWHHRSIADGTDWISLIAAAETALSRLRVLHAVSS
jgi:hypothetical protein